MGPRPDDGAVVDASGRIHGTDRLSVVDAPIEPNGPLGPYLTNQAYRENAGALHAAQRIELRTAGAAPGLPLRARRPA